MVNSMAAIQSNGTADQRFRQVPSGLCKSRMDFSDGGMVSRASTIQFRFPLKSVSTPFQREI